MQAPLPTGTLSLMFTDIESSTVLLRRLGEKYAEALSVQRSILRDAIAAGHGHEMGTEGDSFFVVFETAVDAVLAAVGAQRELLAANWPDGHPVRVRMGLHTGEPVRHEDGYVGMDVHRAARIAASASGGQIVCSDATRQLAAGRLPDGIHAVDLGWHRFKDLVEPEHVHQVVADGLAQEFPPLKSLGTRVNVPRPTTPLVGRDKELAELRELLSGGSARLVTLTGPGGTGKTRLAGAVAAELGGVFTDGVYFVPLEAVQTAEVMWSSIAETLGITGEGRAPPTFFEHIATRNALLVLDNLEQLPEAPEVVNELLAAAPRISVIATSRRPLHLPAEYDRPVAALDYPVSSSNDPAAVASSSAVQLFVERAKRVRSSFELTAENADDVVALCRGLDGLPLAIELAAARARLLSPAALRKRLRAALEFGGPESGRPERHASLRSTIAWSYDLLPPESQAFFRRLGVFSGGCDLDALAAVTTADQDVLELAESLTDVSLATVREGPDGEPRIALLQTVAAFACEQLSARGEYEETRRRHAEYFAELVETLTPQLRSDRYLLTRDRIEGELDNIRAALAWAFGAEKPSGSDAGSVRLSLGLRICQSMSWYWFTFGYLGEGRQWLTSAVEGAGDQQSPELMSTLHGLGVVLLQQGQYTEGRDALMRALDYWRTAGDLDKLSMELNSLGVAHRLLWEPAQARQLLSESAEVARRAGERGRLSSALSNLGILEMDVGDADAAIGLFEESLEIDRELGDAWGTAVSQVNRAGALLQAGRLDEAHAQLVAVAREAVELGDVELSINVFELFCMVFSERGDARAAGALLGMTTAMRDQGELPMAEPDQRLLERSVGKIRSATADDEWESALETGRNWSIETALAEVLDDGEVGGMRPG